MEYVFFFIMALGVGILLYAISSSIDELSRRIERLEDIVTHLPH